MPFCSIERVAKFKKKQSNLLRTAKKGTAETAQTVVDAVSHRSHSDGESWKRDILEGRKRQQLSGYPVNVEQDTSG